MGLPRTSPGSCFHTSLHGTAHHGREQNTKGGPRSAREPPLMGSHAWSLLPACQAQGGGEPQLARGAAALRRRRGLARRRLGDGRRDREDEVVTIVVAA